MTDQEYFDAVQRNQVLLESVKRKQNEDDTNWLLPLILAAFVDTVNGFGETDLGSVSTTKLNKGIRSIQGEISELREAFKERYFDFAESVSIDQYKAFKSFNDGTTEEEDDSSLIPILFMEKPTFSGDTSTALLAAWFSGVSLSVSRILKKAKNESIPTQEVIKTFRGTRPNAYKDGLLGGKLKRGLTSTLNTITQHAAVVGALQAITSDRYRWVSVLDSRTSVICRSLSNRVFQKGKGPLPPAHANCRSTIAPYTGGSIEEPDYYTWLSRQPNSFQDIVLGKKRAELFRSKDMTVSRFKDLQLDKNFKPLTLKEMRAKAPYAFVKQPGR
jgi:hypothetical protein